MFLELFCSSSLSSKWPFAEATSAINHSRARYIKSPVTLSANNESVIGTTAAILKHNSRNARRECARVSQSPQVYEST